MQVALARMPAVKTICEIGFNSGHSASVWLAVRNERKKEKRKKERKKEGRRRRKHPKEFSLTFPFFFSP
jgi:hypothetical protein